MKVLCGTMSVGSTMDTAATKLLLKELKATGCTELDTARMYVGGKTEAVLGEALATSDLQDEFLVHSKVNPWDTPLNSAGVHNQFTKMRKCLGTKKVSIFYLHAPCAKTNIEETLAAVKVVYDGGNGFEELGLSNFTAWEVVYIHQVCTKMGLPPPSVYQGMYNCVTRQVEHDLLPALRRLGMRFYAYNPLCGGLLTGKHAKETFKSLTSGRFNQSTKWGKIYADRFMRDEHFEALEGIRKACDEAGVGMIDAAFAWLRHHSKLDTELGDAIIIGGSSISHCIQNVNAVKHAEKLNEGSLEAFDQGWHTCKVVCPNYERGYSGSALS